MSESKSHFLKNLTDGSFFCNGISQGKNERLQCWQSVTNNLRLNRNESANPFLKVETCGRGNRKIPTDSQRQKIAEAGCIENWSFLSKWKDFIQIFVHLAFYIWLTTSDCFKSCWTSHDLQCVLQHSKTKDVFKCSSQFSNENIFSYIYTLPTCVILCLSPRILIIQKISLFDIGQTYHRSLKKCQGRGRNDSQVNYWHPL